MGGGGRRRASWRNNSVEVGNEAAGRMDPEATIYNNGRKKIIWRKMSKSAKSALGGCTK
jgi:hypothetical protein